MAEQNGTPAAPRNPDSIITTQRNGQTIVAELFFNHSRLLAYSRRYPAICQQTDADPETGCMEFDIEKGRFSFRLTAPYSEERRRAASEAAKAAASNLTRSVV